MPNLMKFCLTDGARSISAKFARHHRKGISLFSYSLAKSFRIPITAFKNVYGNFLCRISSQPSLLILIARSITSFDLDCILCRGTGQGLRVRESLLSKKFFGILNLLVLQSAFQSVSSCHRQVARFLVHTFSIFAVILHVKLNPRCSTRISESDVHFHLSISEFNHSASTRSGKL
jgi:hypothetical protein